MASSSREHKVYETVSYTTSAAGPELFPGWAVMAGLVSVLVSAGGLLGRAAPSGEDDLI
jgi:hypothetical protein